MYMENENSCITELDDRRVHHNEAIKNFLILQKRKGKNLSRYSFLLEVLAVNSHGKQVKGVHITPGNEYVVGNEKDGTRIFGPVLRKAIVLLPTFCEFGETLSLPFTPLGSRCGARNTLDKFEKGGRYVTALKPGTSVYKAYPLYHKPMYPKLREQIFVFDNDELNSSQHFGIHEYYSKLALNTRDNRLINCEDLLQLLLQGEDLPFKDKKLRLHGENIIAGLRAAAARNSTPLKLTGSQALVCIKKFVDNNVSEINQQLHDTPGNYAGFDSTGIDKCLSFTIVIFSACSGSKLHPETNGNYSKGTFSGHNLHSQEPSFNFGPRLELSIESRGGINQNQSRESRPLNETSRNSHFNRRNNKSRSLNNEYNSVVRQFNNNNGNRGRSSIRARSPIRARSRSRNRRSNYT